MRYKVGDKIILTNELNYWADNIRCFYELHGYLTIGSVIEYCNVTTQCRHFNNPTCELNVYQFGTDGRIIACTHEIDNHSELYSYLIPKPKKFQIK